MIPTKITTTGAGTAGELQPGWSVNEESTPIAPGDSSGATESASISLAHGEDSEFLINENVSLIHDELGTFQGYASAANSNGATEDTDTNIPLSLAGISSSLTAERTAQIAAGPNNILEAGEFPYGVPPGGSTPAPINHMAMDIFITNRDLVYMVENISAATIAVLSPSGQKTYIPLTGVNAPVSNLDIYGLAVYNTTIYLFYVVGGVRKLGLFNKTTGAIISSTGTNGTGAGQFGAVGTKVLSLNTDSGFVYVADYGNNRIQRFTLAGAYSSSWAAPDPSIIRVGYSRAYVGSTSAGIVEYTLAGVATGRTFSSTGAQDFSITAGEEGLVVTGVSGGSVFIDLYSVASGGLVNRRMLAGRVNITSIASSRNFTYLSTSRSAILPFDYRLEMYAMDVTTVYTAYAYFASLGGINQISFTATSNPTIPMLPWTDSVWTKMKEMTAAYNQEIAVVNGVLTIRNVGTRTLDLDRVSGGSVSLSISSQQTAETFSISCTNARQLDTAISPSGIYVSRGTLYDAALEGNIMTFNSGVTTTFTLKNNNVPARLDAPVYSITDTDNVPVTPEMFAEAGGSVSARISPDDPYAIEVSVYLRFAPLGTNSSYRFAVVSTPTFSITGSGIFTNPISTLIYTGADAKTASAVKGPDVNNIFISTVSQAYDRGIWRSEQLAGPQLQLNATLPTSELDGFGLTAGSLVSFKESIYRVNTVRTGFATTSITATRRVLQSDAQLVHGGKTMGQVDAFWAGTKYKDQIIKPLRPIV